MIRNVTFDALVANPNPRVKIYVIYGNCYGVHFTKVGRNQNMTNQNVS